jgi:hypothetical protein
MIQPSGVIAREGKRGKRGKEREEREERTKALTWRSLAANFC